MICPSERFGAYSTEQKHERLVKGLLSAEHPNLNAAATETLTALDLPLKLLGPRRGRSAITPMTAKANLLVKHRQYF